MRVLLTLLMLVAWPAQAVAQDDIGAARRLNDEATQLYESGEYADAARKYRAAYELAPDPLLLVFEGVAWFKADSCERARAAVIEYGAATQVERPSQLEQVLVGCDLREAEAALSAGRLEDAADWLRRAEGARERATDKQRARLDRLSEELEQALSPSPPLNEPVGEHAGAEPEPADPKPELLELPTARPKPGRTVLGWSLLGAGVVGIGIQAVSFTRFAILSADQRGWIRECACEATTAASYEGYEDFARRDETLRGIAKNETLYWVVGGVGAALVVTGVVILSTDRGAEVELSLSADRLDLRLVF